MENNGPSTNKSKSALGNLLLANTNNKSPNFVPPVLQEVGRLAAGVASVSTAATGSATGNPRNKCALKPGHSLMDWIRLGNSGKDLTGVGSKAGHLSVTLKELAKHDTESDCWLAIRGRVFNVTAYLPFHPGGVEELMKGAGKDATTLFDQVHPWVNYEQILQKCLVGRLVALDSAVDKEFLFFGRQSFSAPTSPLSTNQPNTIRVPSPVVSNCASENNSKTSSKVNLVTPNESMVDSPSETTVPLPRFDWIQKMDSITLIFYTGPYKNPSVESKPTNSKNETSIILTYCDAVITNELQFFNSVEFPGKIKIFYETGKIEFVFKKCSSGIWNTYGILKQKSNKVERSTKKLEHVILNKIQLNHNIYLLLLERTDKHRLIVPVGQHIRIFADISDSQISRSYTPVPDSLFINYSCQKKTSDSLCLMVKRYENGNVSKFLTDKQIGETVLATRAMGSFDLKKMEKFDKFLLLAAGTGITPMLSLILFLLERRNKMCQSVVLLFFNKTQQDIPFKNQLDDLAKTEQRFQIENILSEADPNWQGRTGHISRTIVSSTLEKSLENTIYTFRDVMCCICGPDAFTAFSEAILKDLAFKKEQIHCFQG